MNKVSIIIPIYNVGDFLSKCIESVLTQKGVLIELILVNDGSTDNSVSICNKYAEHDDRVRVFHQENQGVSVARNVGIKEATGNWICFVDADDWLENGSLEKIYSNCLKNIQDMDMIVARSYINRNGKAAEEKYPAKNEYYKLDFNGKDLFIDYNYVRGSVWGVFYKRDFLLKNKIIFPLKLRNGEDSIFYTQCMIYAKCITFIDAHFYNIYEREGSASRSWTFERILGMVDNISFLNNYIDQNLALDKESLNILNYSKYGVVSNVLNHFSYSFSLSNYIKLRRKIKSLLNEKIDIGDIRTAKNKTKLLNFSLDLFAITIILKNKFK